MGLLPCTGRYEIAGLGWLGIQITRRGDCYAAVVVALGAMDIDKHVKARPTLQTGNDHDCSLQPEELSRSISEIGQVELP